MKRIIHIEPLTSVQKQVVLQVGLLGEAAAADVALEGPRAVVHVHVALEVARRREGLGAQLALVRLLLKQEQVEFSARTTENVT